MDVYQAITYILLGTLMGVVGQGARVVVGIKKEHDEAAVSKKAMRDWFDGRELLASLLIGGIAGAFGAVVLLGAAIDKQLLLSLAAAGYSGADFIEGIMKTRVPK
jgi:hypothetical protein